MLEDTGNFTSCERNKGMWEKLKRLVKGEVLVVVWNMVVKIHWKGDIWTKTWGDVSHVNISLEGLSGRVN